MDMRQMLLNHFVQSGFNLRMGGNNNWIEVIKLLGKGFENRDQNSLV